jgi:hypothetical protein
MESRILPRPVLVDPHIQLKAGERCLIAGEFNFGNWGSTVNISLHNITHPNFGEFDFDLNNPNHVKVGRNFIQRSLHRTVWEWYSKDGIALTFRREFSNPFEMPAALWIRMWNESDTPVQTKGQARMVCQTSAPAPAQQGRL